MTVTYTWSITQLSATHTEDYSDVVTGANWEVFGTDGTNTTSSIGFTPFALPEKTFVSYSDLTEEQVIGWVKAHLSELRLNEVENNIAAALTQLSYQPQQLPWNAPEPEKAVLKSTDKS